MCYVLSRHRLGLEYSDAEVAGALDRFLTKNTNTWLTNGHAARAAEWMKIAYHSDADNALSPKEVVLKCYDHLPGCERMD